MLPNFVVPKRTLAIASAIPGSLDAFSASEALIESIQNFEKLDTTGATLHPLIHGGALSW
jgi:hypothetical protein